MIAETLNNAEATWLLTGIGAIGFLVGIAVGLKTLFWPNDKISPQPLIVAMEKEFVNRQEYERRHTDLENQVKDGRSYAHDRIHDISEVVEALNVDSKNRNERLAALEADSKTHTRQLENVNTKLDRVVDRVADKVEVLLQKERDAR